jgi:hypothetical protein
MPKSVIQSTALTTSGGVAIAAGASIAIRDPGGTLVPLWTDRDGTTSATNPVTADANGFFRVYANPGRVNITITKDGETLTLANVLLVGTLAGQDDPAIADTYIRRNAGNTAYTAQTPAQVLADLRAARHDDLYSDWVVSGLLPATSATLASTISAGTAYVSGRRIEKLATSHTYTASVDTYVDLDSAGTYLFAEVANGAVAPAQPADSIRLAKVVTDATAITSVTDLRETTPEHNLYSQTLQRAFASTGAVVSTTALIPYDDTIPQITEGGEALSIAFTPKRADSRIRIRAVLQIRAAAISKVRSGALFRAGVSDALGVSAAYGDDNAVPAAGLSPVVVEADIASPGTTAQTFSARFGPHTTGTAYLNGNDSGVRVYGGTYASFLEVEEYL